MVRNRLIWVGEGPSRYQVYGSAVMGATSPTSLIARVGTITGSVGIVRINPTCGVGTTPLAASQGVQTTAARASGRPIEAGRQSSPNGRSGGAPQTTRHVRPNAGRPTSSLAHLSGGRPTSVHAPRSVAHPKSRAANAKRRSARPVRSAPEVTHVATSLGPSRDAVGIRHLPSLRVSRSCDAAGHSRHHNSLTRSSVVARGRAR